MTIGLTSVLVIFTWVFFELSYDTFYSDPDRIYRFTVEVQNENGYQSHFARCWQSWTRELPSHFPQIEKMAFLAPFRKTAVKMDQIKFNSNQVFQINPDAFNLFNIQLISGDLSSNLNQPNHVLISESIYQRFFKDKSITGERLELAGAFETKFRDYEISGIFRDFPRNSHIHPEIFVSYDDPQSYEGWAYIYLLLRKGTEISSILNNFQDFVKNYESQETISTLTPHLQPIQRIHLHSKKDREIEKNGDIRAVWLLMSIAALILLLSLINFIQFNLSLILRRKNQYRIQKILGGNFTQYSLSIVIETLITLLISFLFSFLLTLFIANILKQYLPALGASLIIPLAPFVLILFILCGVIILVPSLLMMAGWISSPLHKNGMGSRTEAIVSKRPTYKRHTGLVIFQFAISIILISGSLYIHKQNKYLLNQRMGKQMGPVVIIPDLNWSMKEKNFEFKNRLLSSHLIKNVTSSMEPPSGYVMDAMNFEMEGYEDLENEKSIFVFPVDDNFMDFYQIPILYGEDFQPYDPDLTREDYILNESAVKFLGFQDPAELIGRKFKLNFSIDSIFQGGVIRGIVKDFNLSPLHEKVKPLVMFQKPIWYGTLHIEIDKYAVEESLAFIHSTWDQYYPDYYLDYHFSDDLYRKAYGNEIIQSRISGILTVLSLLVASLGLFGLSSLITQVRTKEITIRKVNGAHSGDIFLMLSGNFLKWILLAFLLAVPVGWWIILKWSQHYPYRTEISWWIFAVAGILAIAIAWISISRQTLKAARKNPAETLRYE